MLGCGIDALRQAAAECGQPLTVHSNHHGTRVSTPLRRVHLGSDRRQDIHQRFLGRYLRNLGLSKT
jgi:hypothetical protein